MNCIPTELIRPYILLCLRVKDFLCLRLVSRDIFNAVTKASIPRLTEKEHLYPRATLICTSECMVCGRRGRMEQKSVPYDDFPRRPLSLLQTGRLPDTDACVDDEPCNGGEENPALRLLSHQAPF